MLESSPDEQLLKDPDIQKFIAGFAPQAKSIKDLLNAWRMYKQANPGQSFLNEPYDLTDDEALQDLILNVKQPKLWASLDSGILNENQVQALKAHWDKFRKYRHDQNQ